MNTAHSPAPDSMGHILAELPEPLAAGAPTGGDLAQILSKAATGTLPVSRLHRFWSLGTLNGRIAGAYAWWWLRGMWTSEESRTQRLNETHLIAALQTLGAMAHLRGAVMKTGQMLAHWPSIPPTEFANLLGRLYFEAPPMHYPIIREVVRGELGAAPEELFAEFEENAVAAASLGQVHRARLRETGAPVAVKVQYPGIARTIRSDIANLRTLLLPMRFGSDGASINDQLADIESVLHGELDYVAEASNLRIARETLADIEGVLVPQVHAHLSSRCVLTMDWVAGRHLDAYLAGKAPQAQRDAFGVLMGRAFMRLAYRSHMLYSDPQPGNYLFMPDGTLGLIDFGCVRRYTQDDVAYLTETEQAAFISRDAVAAAICRGGDLTEKQRRDPQRLELLTAWYDWMMEPVMTDAVFDFGDGTYFRRGMNIWRDILRRRYVRTLPVNTWITRSFVGLRAMLTRLGARVPLGKLMREETTVPQIQRL